MMIRRLFLALAATLFPICLANAQVFGTQDYNVTKVPAATFTGASFNISGSVGRFGNTNVDQHFYAPLDIPLTAVIDYIGLNSLNDGTAGAITVRLLDRDSGGSVAAVATLACQGHNTWQTDTNPTPLGLQFVVSHGFLHFLDVEIPASPNTQFFGWVEVWWKRSVINSLTTPFDDVSPSDPAVDFIGALAASGITSGCGGNNYCPDAPLTRRQMAVFLAKALGLHNPY
ncbi:MAG TPA: S-layer homology domain-containing protein [Thermoanaerobaculia bacterium]|nr:S-layer homology domain-containing protein [Thermoanaerobaculia bacterium]